MAAATAIIPQQTCLMVLLVVFLVAGYATADKVPFQDCGSKGGKIKEVDVTPCPKLPCALKKNSTIKVQVSFTATLPSKQLTAKCFGVIAGAEIPFSLPNPNGCQAHGIKCPVKGKMAYNYQDSLTVPGIAPAGIQLVVKYQLLGDNDTPIFCFEIPAQIVS